MGRSLESAIELARSESRERRNSTVRIYEACEPPGKAAYVVVDHELVRPLVSLYLNGREIWSRDWTPAKCEAD